MSSEERLRKLILLPTISSTVDFLVAAITVLSHESNSNSWFRRRPSCEISDGTRGCLCDCATSWLPWASFYSGFDHANPPFVGSVAHTSTRLQESSVIVKSVTAGRLQACSVSSWKGGKLVEPLVSRILIHTAFVDVKFLASRPYRKNKLILSLRATTQSFSLIRYNSCTYMCVRKVYIFYFALLFYLDNILFF